MSSTLLPEAKESMMTLNTTANHHNSSSSGHATFSMWDLRSPKARMIQIECLVFVTTSLLFFLAVFGTWRRRSRSWFLRGLLWTAYTTSTFLIAYIFGLMQESPFKAKLFPLWGMILLVAYAFPDSFSAYSLEDIEQWKRYYFQFMLKLGGLVFLWAMSLNLNVGLEPMESFLMNAVRLIVLHKFAKRWLSLVKVSRPNMEERAKLSQIYMKYEHELSDGSDIDPCTWKGYNYIVEATGLETFNFEDVLTLTPFDLRKLLQRKDVVTLAKVWSCKGRLLTSSGDPDNRLKDICLSFSLLKILYLKCAGYALPVEAQYKARRLIQEGLLLDVCRCFRAIEVELMLLYELVYTMYPLYNTKRFGCRVTEFLLVVVVYGFSALYIYKYVDSHGSVWSTKVWGLNLDVLGTYILLGMLVLMEIVQVVMISLSEWAKANLVFNYVAKKSQHNNGLVEKLIKVICKPKFSKPWARMVGQYSLIESSGYDIEQSWFSKACVTYLDWNKDGQKESTAIDLSDEVKQAVLDTLRINGTNLENGRSSLRRNGIYEKLPGACEYEHEAQVILIWHIATSYCKHRSLGSMGSQKNRKIANDLSNYLAYLVGFSPRLLPGPCFEPEYHFRRVMKEAREAFNVCTKVEDKISKLDKLAEKQDQTVIVRGARLGKSLLQLGEEEGHDKVWKILAEFWSEMALCAATAGEVREHLDKLAKGGEFVTHLWALLHHVGYSPAHPAALF